MSKPSFRTILLIDTDCGVDDALALILALRSPELDVRSIVTVAGNVEVAQCTQNVLRVLSVLGSDSDVRIAQGSARPLRRRLVTAKEVHGSDGLGDVLPKRSSRGFSAAGTQGARAIIDFCRTWGTTGTIVAIGPLTNIARAWTRDASALRKIGRIVSMGGAFHIPGNTGPVAEFNYYVDPEAAQTVIASGLAVDIIPLDITHQVPLLRSELEDRARAVPGPVSAFVSAVTRSYMLYHDSTEGFNGGYLHDPVAVAAAADPSMFEFVEARVAVETEGSLTRGMTVRFPEGGARPPGTIRGSVGSVRIATRVDRERFLTFFHERTWG